MMYKKAKYMTTIYIYDKKYDNNSMKSEGGEMRLKGS